MYSDSREIIGAYDELNEERSHYVSVLELMPSEGLSDEAKAMLMQFTDWSTMKEEEWETLAQYNDIGRDATSEWSYGTELIPVDKFVEYAEELLKNIGDLPRNLPSYLVIDWDATADNLKDDYNTIELDQEYYVRAV